MELHSPSASAWSSDDDLESPTSPIHEYPVNIAARIRRARTGHGRNSRHDLTAQSAPESADDTNNGDPDNMDMLRFVACCHRRRADRGFFADTFQRLCLPACPRHTGRLCACTGTRARATLWSDSCGISLEDSP